MVRKIIRLRLEQHLEMGKYIKCARADIFQVLRHMRDYPENSMEKKAIDLIIKKIDEVRNIFEEDMLGNYPVEEKATTEVYYGPIKGRD